MIGLRASLMCALIGFMGHGQSPQPVTVDVAPGPSEKFPANWYPADNDVTYTGAPEKGAPYTATLITTSSFVNPASGLHQIFRTSTFQARDAAGRKRDEVERNMPDGHGGTVAIRAVSVNDPVSHCSFSWTEPWLGQEKPRATVQCLSRTLHFQVQNLFADTMATEARETSSVDGVDRTEPLGKRWFGEVQASGVRRTRIITEQSTGKVQKLATEVWFSPDLKEMVDFKPNFDPQTSAPFPEYELKDIHRIEPDPSLFYPPPGYLIAP